MIVYLGLGSNLGDRERNLREALHRLTRLGTIEAVAGLWETEPVGYADQAAFLNTAVALRTALPPLDLLGRLKQIERALGRAESFRNAPRPIDLDVLLYANDVYQHERLTIPHPRLHERRFVLAPLAQIAPGARHPLLGRTVTELLEALEAGAWVRLVAPPGWEREATDAK